MNFFIIYLNFQTDNSQTSTIHSMVEKDFNKISIVCVNSLIPILISFVAQAIALANVDNNVLASAMQMIQTITGPFMYCADELCLMILLPEFRRIIKEFMRTITCRKNNNNNQNSRNVPVIPVSVSSAVAMNKQTQWLSCVDMIWHKFAYFFSLWF